MPLFQVQDYDGDRFVLAADWNEARFKYCKQIAEENECEVEDVPTFKGIVYVCDDEDLIQ